MGKMTRRKPREWTLYPVYVHNNSEHVGKGYVFVPNSERPFPPMTMQEIIPLVEVLPKKRKVRT